jgi:rhodanese-related sulfurtransferase
MFGPPRVPTVSAADVPADAVVLDVREDDEWVAGHIPGALHVPLQELPSSLEDLPLAEQLVVVCRVGGRSAQAVAWLAAMGRDAVNLDGGMYAWEQAGRPMIAEGHGDPYVA